MKKIVKNFYKLVPAKQQMFRLLKTVWTPPKGIYQHLHFEGVLNINADKSNSFKIQHYGYQIENELFWEGVKNGWEKLSFKLWIEMCKTSSVIFDIGANTGVYSLIAKSLNPNSLVYAFEPVDFVFDKLTHNNKLNNFDINCIELACSDFFGEAKIFIPQGAEMITSVTINKSLLDSKTVADEKKIKTIRLDEFIEQKGITQIDLMKIDVETHEPEVLEGMGKYLKLFKPTMLIEILNNEVGEKVERILDGLEYLYFDIDEISKIKQIEHIRKSSHFNYFVCQKEIAKKLNLITG